MYFQNPKVKCFSQRMNQDFVIISRILKMFHLAMMSLHLNVSDERYHILENVENLKSLKNTKQS